MSHSQSQTSIPCPVKIDTASVKPAARRYNTVNAADIVSQFSTMTISNPVKHANTTSQVAARHQPKSLPTNVFTAKGVSASQRIQERRKLVAAKLGLSTQRPKQPVKTTGPVNSPVTVTPPTPVSNSRLPPTSMPPYPAPTSATKSTSMSSRAAIPTPRAYGWVQIQLGENFRQGTPALRGHITQFVTISDRTFYADSRIPTVSDGRRPFAIAFRLPATFEPVFLSLKSYGSIRGSSSYTARICKGRCHGDRLPCGSCQIQPASWASTLAEADVVDPRRPRKVRFAGQSRVRYFDKWYRDAFWLRSDYKTRRYKSYTSRANYEG